MGCCFSRSGGWGAKVSSGSKKLKRPHWKSDKPISAQQLQAQREEFWDTAPHYGGEQVIWDALKGASEADTETALVILESAGITFTNHSLHICYDERGRKYELPDYVLAPPTNLDRSSTKTDTQQIELMTRNDSAPIG